MKDDLKEIRFENKTNINSQFDILSIEELFQRKILDHSIDTNHKVEFYIIFFAQDGKGNHNVDFTDFECSKGTILTIRKGQIQKFSSDSKLKGSLLIFTDDFLVSYLEEMETQKTMLLFNELIGDPKLQLSKSHFKNINENIARIKNEYFNIQDKHSLGIIRSQLHILISQLFRLKSAADSTNYQKKYLKEFIQFQDLVEKNATTTSKVQEYAKMMRLSTKTLNTVTKSIVHKSAKAFIDEIRIKQIKRLLINTKLSIKEIAYSSGFEEPTNFYNYFKKQTSTTPELFRATL